MNSKPIARKTTLKRKPIKTDAQKKWAARRKKNDKERELWASFGLIRPQKPRYVGLQGICWFLASNAVRRQEWGLYGVCVDGCGTVIEDWKNADCGHFQGAGSAKTRFSRENLGLQSKTCNMEQRNGKAIQYSYGKVINQRYGEGTAERLIEESKQKHTFKEEELLEIIAYYQKILESLE